MNQLTNGETKKSDGTQVARKEYKYDANGNQIQEIESVEKKEKETTIIIKIRREVSQTSETQKGKVLSLISIRILGKRVFMVIKIFIMKSVIMKLSTIKIQVYII